MRLSEQTKKLLENYASINNGILIQATKDGEATTPLKTCDAHKFVMAQTQVSEKFDHNVCLYDLKAFLSVISSLKDPEIQFNDNHVLINDANSSIKMNYADPMTISHLTKNVTVPTPTVSFDLKAAELSKLLNFSSILSLTDLKLSSRAGKLVFQALDKKNSTSSTYEVEVGVGDTQEEFLFSRELFKMTPGDYRVEVSSKAARFISQDHTGLEYIVALAVK